MAITVEGTTKASSSAGGSTVAVSVPAGLQDNDYLIAFGVAGNSTSTWTGPAGFVAHTSEVVTGQRKISIRAFSRLITDAATEPANYTFDSNNGSANPRFACLVIVRGANVTTLKDVLEGTNGGVNDGHPDSPSVTTVTDGALVLIAEGLASSFITSIGTPTGTTLQESNVEADLNFGLASFVQASAGATGAKNWPNGGDASDQSEWATYTFAVRPAAGGGGIDVSLPVVSATADPGTSLGVQHLLDAVSVPVVIPSDSLRVRHDFRIASVSAAALPMMVNLGSGPISLGVSHVGIEIACDLGGV